MPGWMFDSVALIDYYHGRPGGGSLRRDDSERRGYRRFLHGRRASYSGNGKPGKDHPVRLSGAG